MKTSVFIFISLLFAITGFSQKTGTKTNRNVEKTKKVLPVPTSDNSVHSSAGLERLPEYPGGITVFKNFIEKKIDYKKLAFHYDNDNVVPILAFIRFVVEKDGTITNLKILRDPGYGAGKEIERVVKLDKTKWSPGIQNGKAVRAQYNLPILIKVPG